MKNLLWAAMLLAAGGQAAEAPEMAFGQYRVANIEHTLPQEITDHFLGSLTAVAAALKDCKNYAVTVNNPLVRRDSRFRVVRSGGVGSGCRYRYQREMRWQYDCLFDQSERQAMAAILQRQAASHAALGDLAEDEQAFLFNRRWCDVSKL